MRTILFTVSGLPPNIKKNDKSMWGIESQAKKLIFLREAAKNEMEKCGYTEPLVTNVRLTLHVQMKEDPQGGSRPSDLDNFINGVCDGLMAADQNVLKHESWHDLFNKMADQAVHPRESIVYKDDSQIREIHAKKTVPDGHEWYRVEVEELMNE